MLALWTCGLGLGGLAYSPYAKPSQYKAFVDEFPTKELPEQGQEF